MGDVKENRQWTVQEILCQLARCANDNFCAQRCDEEPCVLEQAEFLHCIAKRLEMQRAEIASLRQTSEGHRYMVAKLREELQEANKKYINLRRRTMEEIRKLLNEEED